MKFDIQDLKTAGSTVITLAKLNDLEEHERVTVRVTVVKVYNVQKIGARSKQDVLVADTTGKATKHYGKLTTTHCWKENPTS